MWAVFVQTVMPTPKTHTVCQLIIDMIASVSYWRKMKHYISTFTFLSGSYLTYSAFLFHHMVHFLVYEKDGPDRQVEGTQSMGLWAWGPYLCLLVDVPGEGNGVVGDLLNVADGVETLLVVGCGGAKVRGQRGESKGSTEPREASWGTSGRVWRGGDGEERRVFHKSETREE